MDQKRASRSPTPVADAVYGTPREPGEVRLLRPEQAAERLGISRSKVFELLASGELESIKIGRSRRIPVGAVAQFIAGRSR